MVTKMANGLNMVEVDGLTFPLVSIQFERAGRLFIAMVDDFEDCEDATIAMKSVKAFFDGDATDYHSDLILCAAATPKTTVVKPEYLFPGWGS